MLNSVQIDELADISVMMEEAGHHVAGRSPTESLADALHKANQMVAVLGVLVTSLRPRAQSSTTTVAEDTPRERTEWIVSEEGLVGPDPDGKLDVHPWMRLYETWTDRQAKLAKMALDVGLMERQTRVQESQTTLMAQALMNILSELGIDLEDPHTQGVIETHLLALDQPIDVAPGLTATVTSS